MLGRPIIRKINRDYFEQIDTEEKAYWLGFIAADGCITSIRGKYNLRVALASVDSTHLEKLANAMEYDGVIGNYNAIRGGKTYSTATFSTSSAKIADDLMRHGITPRKSFTLVPWEGPPELMRHYWRGLFDGDGSLHTGKGTWVATLVGTPYIASGFRAYLESQGIFGGTTSLRTEKKMTAQISYHGRNLPKSIVEALYSGATIYLDRKMKIAQDWLSTDTNRTANPVCGKAGFDRIKALYDECHNYVNMEKVLGIGRTTLRNYCLRNGISVSKTYTKSITT